MILKSMVVLSGTGNEPLCGRRIFDCGLTGRDWVKENESDVEVVTDLVYSRASNRISKWVLAVPEASR